MRRLCTAAVMVATLVLGARASNAKTDAAKPAIDPEAMGALRNMGEFLRTQQVFAVQAKMTTDDVIGSGQKVQFNGTVDLKVRRPDRLRMDINSDRRNERIFYDGKTFTVFGERLGFYATFPAPPTLNELREVLEKKYAFELPLADLFYWGTDQDGSALITGATNVGVSTIDGFVCEHFAFRQKDIDWEIWIEKGGRRLPHKVVITTTTEKSKPQHSMTLNWDLGPKLDEQAFTFNAPPTAHQIDFMPAGKAGTQKGGSTP